MEDLRLEEEGDEVLTPTPRGGGKGDVSAIPTPKGLGGNRLSGVGRRTSSGLGVRREEGDMGPPEWRGGGKKLSGVGESY